MHVMVNMFCNGILIDNLTGLESALIIQMGFDSPFRLYTCLLSHPEYKITGQNKIFLFAKYIVNLHINK